MSLSDVPNPSGDDEPRWGTIFMGPDKSRESRMDKVLSLQERELWNRSTENEYMERVRARATLRAQAVLDKAKENSEAIRQAARTWAESIRSRNENLHAEATRTLAEAEQTRAEAEHIRSLAQEEGYQAGIDAAREEIASWEQVRGAATSVVLHRVQEQCGVIFEAWREELAALVRESVTTATGWVMTEERAAVIGQLVTNAVLALESRRRIAIHVNPEDAAGVETMLAEAHGRLGVEQWDVQADPEMEPGAVVLESSSGRVEDDPGKRRAIVEEALARLCVPVSAVDAAAVDAVRAPCSELDALPIPPEPDPVPESEILDAVSAPDDPAAMDRSDDGTEIAGEADAGLELPGLDAALVADDGGAQPAPGVEEDLPVEDEPRADASLLLAEQMPENVPHDAGGEAALPAVQIPDGSPDTADLADPDLADALDAAFTVVEDDGSVDAVIDLEPEATHA